MAYRVYALATVACALAISLPLFLAATAVQGMANAFTSRCCWPPSPGRSG